MQRVVIHLTRVASALHTEHLVALAYVNDHLAPHQIGAECYLTYPVTVIVQDIHKQTGVKHYIPVIAYKQIALGGIKQLHAAVGKAVSSTCYHLLVHLFHHGGLELTDIAAAQQDIPDIGHAAAWIDIASHLREHGIRYYSLHCGRNLLIPVRTDIVKSGLSLHSGYFLWSINLTGLRPVGG